MLDQSRNKIERYTSDRKMAETKQADIWVKYMKKKQTRNWYWYSFQVQDRVGIV